MKRQVRRSRKGEWKVKERQGRGTAGRQVEAGGDPGAGGEQGELSGPCSTTC